MERLPTTAFFYGLKVAEEIPIEIDPGKILFIKLIGFSEPDNEGRVNVFYELNGMPRESQVVDLANVPKGQTTRQKGDPKNSLHTSAPMPGMIIGINTGVGSKIEEGDPLITIEAMKMQTTISAEKSGTVNEILVAEGETVETGDLLVILK